MQLVDVYDDSWWKCSQRASLNFLQPVKGMWFKISSVALDEAVNQLF
jgi:hypothetical protein